MNGFTRTYLWAHLASRFTVPSLESTNDPPFTVYDLDLNSVCLNSSVMFLGPFLILLGMLHSEEVHSQILPSMSKIPVHTNTGVKYLSIQIQVWCGAYITGYFQKYLVTPI